MVGSPTGTGICPDLRKLENQSDLCYLCVPYPGNRYTQIKESHRPHLGMFPTRAIPGGEYGLEFVHTPFCLSKLKEIKRDLGSYIDNPDHYVQAFQQLTQIYVMAWKDSIL
jgi:hypothetical protein